MIFMATLQKISDLKTNRAKLLFKSVYNDIIKAVTDWNSPLAQNLYYDRQRQSKNRITTLVIEKPNQEPYINPEVIAWLRNHRKSDIVGIDDVPKDTIKRLRNPDTYSKKERRLLAQLRKENNQRPEHKLIKDLLGNEEVLKLSEENANKWRRNKTKYDIEHVDTIPPQVAGYTASLLAKEYPLTTKKNRYSRMTSSTRGVYRRTFSKMENTLGAFSPDKENAAIKNRLIRINRILKGSGQGQITLAHEIGHAYDYFKYSFAKPPSDVITDMKVLAQKLNPPTISFEMYGKMKSAGEKIPRYIARYMEYRLNHKELLADSFAFLVYNPEYVKTKHKAFYNYLVKANPKLKTILDKGRVKVVTNIVKGIKKDYGYLNRERRAKERTQINNEIDKLKSRTRIGIKTKQKIANLHKKLKNV